MTVLYVVSDREGAGKTAVCATLAGKLAGMDSKTALVKPIAASGLAAGDDPDAASYAGLLGTLYRRLALPGWKRPAYRRDGEQNEGRGRPAVLISRRGDRRGLCRSPGR